MNQVEIAKKILEQGDCRGIGCSGDGCEFLMKHSNNCRMQLGNTSDIDLNKVKQWLKEREVMIDLSVNQIVDPPVKCWVRDCDEETYDEDLLFSVDHRKTKRAFATENGMFKQCTLTDPTVSTKKIKKWLTVEDVPVELWGRALTKKKHQPVSYANILKPSIMTFEDGRVDHEYHYVPLGQPLTGEWLPFENEE